MAEAKTTTKESPADAVERIKREQAEKLAAKNAAENDPDPSKTESTTGNAELKKQADEALAKALADEPETIAKSTDTDYEARMDAAQKAADNLKSIALSYPRSTPDSHTLFGAAGRRFTLGELRALFNLKQG